MQTKRNLSPTAAELRRLAEERLREQHPEPGAERANPDTQRLLHELQVHQIELEMQNKELQHARDKMEAELERYSDLYDFAPVGYLTLDRVGTICEANLTSASLLGIERSRLVQQRFGISVAVVDQPAFNAFLKKVFESNSRESCEVTLLRKGLPPAEVRIEAAVAVAGGECRAVLVDITEHNRAEKDLLILNKLESTGILAGGLAHDFNNLLAVIVLNLDVAKMLVAPGQELARRVEEAKQSALLARGLTQQLITFAKGGSSIRKLISLNKVIRESGRPALSGSRVGCEFSLAEDLWTAEVDEGQIGQVIRNVVLNAREAMPQGGVVSIDAKNVVLGPREIPPLPPGDYVQVSVADRGSGIAPEVLPRIFDPYFSTKRRGTQKGMGLGLTICYSVIQNHGGAITVKSEAGVGTTFHIYLPASRKALGQPKALLPKVISRQARILVMDDDEGMRKMVGIVLERMGHEVELVADGQKAIEIYERAKGQGRSFDAAFLDLTVCAGLGGMEAIQALHKIDPDVKGVVMSGYANDPVVLEPERYGFKGVLAKPFDSDSVREILSRVLGPAIRENDRKRPCQE